MKAPTAVAAAKMIKDCDVNVAVLEQLGLEADSSYSTSLPRNFPPSRDVAMGDRPMVCAITTPTTRRI